MSHATRLYVWADRKVRRNRWNRQSKTAAALTSALLLGWLAAPVVRAEPFMIVALPDPQNYSDYLPATFNAQTQWIVDNTASQNIKFVTELGDIVQNRGELDEWANAKAAMTILDTANMPYGTVMGNHDGRNSDTTNYHNNFGPQNFQGKSWYGGASPSGLSNYQTISAGGKSYLFLQVQIDTPQDELDWAQTVLEQNRDKPVVFSTHRYLQDFRVMQGRYTRYDYPGFDGYYETDYVMSEDLFQNFIRINKNIYMVLCGHCAGQYHQVSQNNWGLPVYEILQDFDSFTPNGGDGWMRLFTVDPDAGQIAVQMYSPTLSRFRVDGPKATHEDFQNTLLIMQDESVVAAIGAYFQRENPTIDPEEYFNWLMADDAQNLWNVSYADGQRDSSFTINVDFAAHATSFSDLDNDGDVDGFDFLTFANCFNGSGRLPLAACERLAADIDIDGDVDGFDFLTFANCYNGSNRPALCQ